MIKEKKNINNFVSLTDGCCENKIMVRLFLVFMTSLFVLVGNASAMDTLMISGNGGANSGKSKIMLLKPCIEVLEKREIIREVEKMEETKKTEETEKELAKNIEKNKIDGIDDLLDYLDEEGKKFEEDGKGVENKKSDNSDKKSGNSEDKNIKEIKEFEEKMLFKYYSGKNEKILSNIYNKIIDNLNTIGLYEIKYNKNSCQDMTKFLEKNETNDIEDYIFNEDLANNDYVIGATLELLEKNELKVQLYVWDILDEKFTNGKYYIINMDNENNSYRLSNMISDFIFKSTTGESHGIFDSKIMYVAETGSPLEREKQVAIMNFDGTKNTKITKSKNMKLTPIFSRNNPNEIFYMEYLPEGAFVVNHNLINGKITKILTRDQNMTSAATSNPNGKNQIILAGTKNRETNLFLFDFTTKKNRQITNNRSINTAPSFNPDGDKIVYVSDRTGSRKLYIKDLDSNKDELLTKEGGVYDKPAWSPDGKLIAFIKLSGGQFQLGVMTYAGTAERILTSAYLIEGVKWSPNSRYLIYTKQKGPYGVDSIPRIYIRDILTGFEYRLKTPKQEGASDPDWIMNF